MIEMNSELFDLFLFPPMRVFCDTTPWQADVRGKISKTVYYFGFYY